jgi:hypothetical protein
MENLIDSMKAYYRGREIIVHITRLRHGSLPHKYTHLLCFFRLHATTRPPSAHYTISTYCTATLPSPLPPLPFILSTAISNTPSLSTTFIPLKSPSPGNVNLRCHAPAGRSWSR